MDYQTVNLKEFRVMGLSWCVSNEGNALDTIENLWREFKHKNLRDLIPHIDSQEIVCLYTDYENSLEGPYTVILGYRISPIDFVPEGLEAKTVPASKYAVFHIKGNNLVEEVVKAWEKIRLINLDRTFTGDFEVYKVENTNEADLFVAIK